MADTNLSAVTTTNTKAAVADYSVNARHTDAAQNQDENYYDFPNSSKYLGYYKSIPELKKAVDALATWVMGKGYTANPEAQVILDHITGWGEDNFDDVLWNMLVCKKIYGDAFAEVVRDTDSGELINIKPLDTSVMRVVVNKKGIITRYEQRAKAGGKETFKTFKPNEILHLANDRVADEIHGTSVIEACQWVIDARNEAMADLRRIYHRNVVPLRIIEVDSDNSQKISSLKTQYEQAIKNGEVLVIPKGNVAISEAPITFNDPQGWIRYLENFFYQAVGIPKVILGGSEEFTEASSKIGYLTFEQIYSKEHKELEADLWNQLYLRVEFYKPASLMNELISSDTKNTSQTGFQPNDVMAGAGK